MHIIAQQPFFDGIRRNFQTVDVEIALFFRKDRFLKNALLMSVDPAFKFDFCRPADLEGEFLSAGECGHGVGQSVPCRQIKEDRIEFSSDTLHGFIGSVACRSNSGRSAVQVDGNQQKQKNCRKYLFHSLLSVPAVVIKEGTSVAETAAAAAVKVAYSGKV